MSLVDDGSRSVAYDETLADSNEKLSVSFLRDPRVYLATERTFLAWIRTGLALMGFGFVVARFGLFMRELYATRGDAIQPPQGISLRFGTALVVLGVVLTITAVFRYVALLKRLDRGEGTPAPVASRDLTPG